MASSIASEADVSPVADPNDDVLPGLAYRSWFLFVMTMVSASVVGERYMMSVMVGPIKAELHLSDAAIGVVKDLVIALVYIIAVVPLARMADRFSKRRLVAMAATIWSVAVLVCGAAKGYTMLVVGRSGIGLGEGCFTPPSQSWIADLFPMKWRATALSIFLLGASLGTFLGPALGGWMAHEYGWRQAMMLASIPGFILVPIVWFTLRDTRAGLADGSTVEQTQQRPFMQTVRELLAIRTFPLLVGAAALNALLTMGMISWAPAFMERSHGMPMQQAGLQMGGALFVGSIIGHSLGGPLSDFLGRRDLRWYIWIMVMSGLMATGIGWLILTGPGEWVFPLYGLNLLMGGLSAAPLMAVVAGLAPTHCRSTAVALLMVAINVIGLGGGPAFIGWLSTQLAPSYGEAALGMAMRCVLLVGIPSTILSWLAGRTCRADFAHAGGWDGGRSTATPH
jgi:predicted MFS family arabinose efflux permease